MPKWELNEAFGKVVITGTTNIYCDSNPSAEVAKMLHNADIDALEAEIVDLKASRPAETAYLDLSNAQLVIDYEQALSGHAAANATLSALREEFGNFNCNETCKECGAVSRHENARLFRIWKLLNPTPTPEKESLRDKAARLGFDEMPADLGQRNLDGETNYVALPPETNDDHE